MNEALDNLITSLLYYVMALQIQCLEIFSGSFFSLEDEIRRDHPHRDEFEPESINYLEKGFDSLADSSNLKHF